MNHLVRERLQAQLNEKLTSPASADDILLTRPEAALYLGLSSKSLEAYGSSKYHELKYSIIGNRAMYRLSAVQNFVSLKTKGGQS